MIGNQKIAFCASLYQATNNYNELEQITADVQLDSNTVEAFDSANPENGFDIKVPAS